MSTVTSSTGRRSRRSVDSETAQPEHGDARHGAYLLALLLLSLFAWAPLLYPGYIQVHSGFLPVFNLANLAASPNKLTWLPSIGVTPDLLRGEGPLAYWLALLLRPLAGDVGAIKGIFALSIIALGLGVFAWTQRDLSGFEGASTGADGLDANPTGLLSTRAGLLAAVLIMLWPPLLVTVYVRGALAEALFMALLPWALWAVSVVRWQVAGGKFRVSRFTHVFAAGLLAAGLFWTQAGLALWATALLLAWALWPGTAMRSRGITAGAVAAGALLGGGLFALLHRGLGVSGQALDVAAHAVYPYQLLSAAWGFGVSTTGWQDSLSLQLGFAALSLAVLTVVLGSAGLFHKPTAGHRSPTPALRAGASVLRTGKPGSPIIEYPLGLAAIAALVLILLTTTLARPLWRIELLAATLTYPWQLYALAGPLLVLMGSAAIVIERRLAVLPVWAAAVTLVVLSSYPYLAPRFTPVAPDPAAPSIFGLGQVTLLTAAVSVGEADAAEDWEPSRRDRLEQGATPTPTEGEGRGEDEALTVMVAWQALQPVDFDYNVFVHALDAAGNRVAQWDGQPQGDGEPYPMTTWSVGEIVENSYRLELDPTAAQVQRIDMGLYNWQTGERLPVNGADKVMLEVGP
jgi:hypothetical protein